MSYAAELDTQVVLVPPIVMIVISLIIPLVVGLLTKLSVPSGVKAVMMIVLNAVNAFVVTAVVVDGSGVFTQEAFVNWLMGVVVSVATYLGLYKPLDITSSTPTGKLGPTVGLGPDVRVD